VSLGDPHLLFGCVAPPPPPAGDPTLDPLLSFFRKS
jgi:hypothetical protein